METLLHHYAWGKPREEIEVSADVIIRNVATMSTEDLMAELEAHQQATALFLTQQTPVRDVLAAPS